MKNLDLPSTAGALVVLTLLAATLTVGGSAAAFDTDRTGPLDGGFPRYYVDEAGRALQICDDRTRFCDGVGPRALRPPDGEALYWAALSPLRSHPTRRVRVDLSVEFALEAAFEGRRPVVFRRLRVRGHVEHRGRYVLLHPYGTLRFRAITPREQRNVDVTVDKRCSRVRDGRCAPGWTRWLTSVDRERGYLGRRGRTRVNGGRVRNVLRLFGPAGNQIARSEQFRVIGKVCGRPCRRGR